VARLSLECEVGQDLADHRAELVAVAREAGTNDRVRRLRVNVDEEVLVRRRLEEAGLERHRRAGSIREVAFGEGAQRRLVLERRLARDGVGIASCSEVVVAPELEAGDAVRWEAVEVLAVEREIEDRHARGLEELGPARLEPCERLADAAHRARRESRDVLGPGAGGQHETVRLDDASVRPHAHAAFELVPLEDALARSQHSALLECPAHVRDDAPLRDDEAALGLVGDAHLGRQTVGGEPLGDLGACEHLVLEVVLGARAEDAVEDSVSALDDPGHVQELFAGLRLELAPELVRASQERHVVGMLEVREADDPRQPVRRAVLVQEVEALEAEHALPAARKVVERRAPHAADADDDHVVPLHGPDPNRGWLNEPMPTAVEQLGDNRVRLTVDVSSDQVKHAVEHAMSDLSASVKIPGFRSGKIPSQVLVSRLGKERIYAEAVDSHIGGWFWSAASSSRVRPVSDPQYEFELPANADARWSFVATVEVQALPELVDWTQLEVPRADVEVPQESVAAEIEALRESVAELAPAGERPAQPGDTLVVDLLDADGEAQPDTVVELGGGRLAPELEVALVGASAGETKAIELPLADGKTSTVAITVREVQEKVLPDIDDELARAASEFDTIDELRASIEGTLREQLDAEIDAAFRITAVDELVRASEVQPALPLVRTRAADLLTGFARSLERRGVSLETYLAASGGSAQDLERQMVLEAAVSVARELALESLAEKAGIEISDEDVNAYIREEAAASGEADADGVIEDVWAHGQQESIREDLRLRAALDRLVEDVQPIAPELAEARDRLWTPDKEKAAGDTKLWTPGSKESE